MDIKLTLIQLQQTAGPEIAEKAAILDHVINMNRDGILSKEQFGQELDSMLNWNQFDILVKNHVVGKAPTKEEWQTLIDCAIVAYRN